MVPMSPVTKGFKHLEEMKIVVWTMCLYDGGLSWHQKKYGDGGLKRLQQSLVQISS